MVATSQCVWQGCCAAMVATKQCVVRLLCCHSCHYTACESRLLCCHSCHYKACEARLLCCHGCHHAACVARMYNYDAGEVHEGREAQERISKLLVASAGFHCSISVKKGAGHNQGSRIVYRNEMPMIPGLPFHFLVTINYFLN